MSLELRRLELLKTHQILHSNQEQFYDDITLLASRICDCPISLITIIAEDYQWVKSSIGLIPKQTPRESSFCSYAIETSNDIMVVEDATTDKRFGTNELVVGDPGIRFYAGYPLTVEEDLALGALCVIDTKPRTPTQHELESLESLGRIVTKFLQIRKQIISLHDVRDVWDHDSRLEAISKDLNEMLGVKI